MQKKNDKDPGFKIGDHVETFLDKDTLQLRLKKFSLLKKCISWTYVTGDLNREKYLGTYYEEELQNTNQTDFRV